MKTFSILLVCINIFVKSTWATTVGEHTDSGFCYRDSEGCGPSSQDWAPLCHQGKRQSPINLPLIGIPLGSTPLKISAYQGNSFRMQNNGHSVQVDFNNQGPSTQLLAFPDPLKVIGPYTTTQGQRQYKFASAHFHWGVNDYATGSEHCIGGRCSAMELHLVHYLAKYNDMASAVASGDKNALAVVAVLIDVNIFKTVGNGLLNMLNHQNLNEGSGILGPIVKNLKKVAVASHESSKWTTINEPLRLDRLLALATKKGMFTYKGSLTTPGCNEQVNWYVMKDRATTSHQDLELFRSILKDSRNELLTENHRPLQPLNGRKVLLSKIIAY